MIHFYKERDKYGEFSNFYKHKTPLIYEGKPYSTSEHLYQCRKYLFEGCSAINREYAEVIRCASSPYKAKLLANMQCLKRFSWQKELGAVILDFKKRGALANPNFHSKNIEIMREILSLKFEQDKHCREVLLETVGFSLAEHTSRDKFWGDGGDGKGKNHLGRLLTQLRNDLVGQSSMKRKAEDGGDQPVVKRQVETVTQRNELEERCEQCPDWVHIPWKFECHLCNKKLCGNCRFRCPNCAALVCDEHFWFCVRCDNKSCYNCKKPLILFDTVNETYCEDCLCLMEHEVWQSSDEMVRVVRKKDNYVFHYGKDERWPNDDSVDVYKLYE